MSLPGTSRREFELTAEQFDTLTQAARPTPAMWGSGGQPMFSSPQENANRAWQQLGREMGFDWATVQPNSGKPQTWFSAEVSASDSERVLAAQIAAAQAEYDAAQLDVGAAQDRYDAAATKLTKLEAENVASH